MSQPWQTKKQKKALAFRTRQKTGKKKNKDLDDEDGFGFPIDENQDLAGLADLPPETEEVFAGGRPGGRKDKAEDGGQHQAQTAGSKKRTREDEEVIEEKPRKKSKIQPTVPDSGVEDDDAQKAVGMRKVQPQRFILFIGAFLAHLCLRQGSLVTVGNLKYSTTKDAILSHFSSCGKAAL